MKDVQFYTTGAETECVFCRINIPNFYLSLRFLKYFNGLSLSRLSLNYLSCKQRIDENKEYDKFNLIFITDTDY